MRTVAAVRGSYPRLSVCVCALESIDLRCSSIRFKFQRHLCFSFRTSPKRRRGEEVYRYCTINVVIGGDGEAPAVVAGFAGALSKGDPHPAASCVRGG